MTEFPLSPGLSRTVILSASLGCANLVLPVAAMLSVENVFVTPGGKKNLSAATKVHKDLAEQAGGTNDFATLLYVYRKCHSRLVKSSLNVKKPAFFVAFCSFCIPALGRVVQSPIKLIYD